MGVPVRVEHLPPRHEVRHAHAAHDAVVEVFGERPQTPLDQGLREMAAWVRRHGARRSLPFAGIEIARGLPPSWAT
jgi:nucleoside-diphosphate-sugar epimerase